MKFTLIENDDHVTNNTMCIKLGGDTSLLLKYNKHTISQNTMI